MRPLFAGNGRSVGQSKYEFDDFIFDFSGGAAGEANAFCYLSDNEAKANSPVRNGAIFLPQLAAALARVLGVEFPSPAILFNETPNSSKFLINK